jgi:hypothetical protein
LLPIARIGVKGVPGGSSVAASMPCASTSASRNVRPAPSRDSLPPLLALTSIALLLPLPAARLLRLPAVAAGRPLSLVPVPLLLPLDSTDIQGPTGKSRMALGKPAPRQAALSISWYAQRPLAPVMKT